MASEQEEELETLMSIYGDKITVITQGKEYIVQLEPHLSSALQLVLKRQTVDVPQQLPSEPKSAQIAHLSPVSLYVRCPLDYPALRHPECHISAPWLDPELATVVSKKLKEKFTPGNVVVFEWICYIQEELVSELSKLQNSTPAAYDGRDSGSGPQLFVRSNSQYDDLIACDQQRAYMEFFQSAHTCDVCFKDLPGESFCEPCRGCHIVVCKSCLIQSCKSRVDSGLTTVMKCVNCDNILSDIMLNGILPTELYNRYAHLIEESQLDSIPGMVYCPRPRCNKRTVSDPKESLAVCSSCSLPFCKLCRQVYHGTGPCPAPKPQKSFMWKDVKVCPRCRFSIQKIDGCNKMSCIKCGALFCWICTLEIEGYSHFDSGSCHLFESPPHVQQLLRDQLEMEAAEETHLQDNCPRCNQSVTKTMESNWMRCIRCNYQFCFLCREACYGAWHFDKYGCKEKTSVAYDLKLLAKRHQ
eukprot:Em0019g742a